MTATSYSGNQPRPAWFSWGRRTKRGMKVEKDGRWRDAASEVFTLRCLVLMGEDAAPRDGKRNEKEKEEE